MMTDGAPNIAAAVPPPACSGAVLFCCPGAAPGRVRAGRGLPPSAAEFSFLFAPAQSGGWLSLRGLTFPTAGVPRLFLPGADRGLPLISPPAQAGGCLSLLGAAAYFSPGAGREAGFSLRGHTFSPAAERKYQRDAAREGLFTETPLSGLSLLRGKSQPRSCVLSLCSLLSFCCRSAAADATRTRLRSLAVASLGS